VTQLLCIWLSLTMVGAVQQEFVGTWTGTWDGAGTGGFELTLEKGKDGGLTGRVSVTGEPTYKATLRTVSFTGNKMSAAYDFPPDDQIEVVLSATFEGDTAKGTWVARGKGGGADLANGTWTVARK
jgi:hypothetical protein